MEYQQIKNTIISTNPKGLNYGEPHRWCNG